MKEVTLAVNGAIVCRAEVADNVFTRARGLLGRKSLPEGRGLLIRPCNSVHMFFMRFPIDVVFLSREGRIVKIVEQLGLFRMASGGRGAHTVLELPAGYAASVGLKVGDMLSFATPEYV
jgi:uncharacterized membrane protein (UPF0127 family)